MAEDGVEDNAGTETEEEENDKEGEETEEEVEDDIGKETEEGVKDDADPETEAELSSTWTGFSAMKIQIRLLALSLQTEFPIYLGILALEQVFMELVRSLLSKSFFFFLIY